MTKGPEQTSHRLLSGLPLDVSVRSLTRRMSSSLWSCYREFTDNREGCQEVTFIPSGNPLNNPSTQALSLVAGS